MKMTRLLILTSMLVAVVACSDDNEPARTPTISVNTSSTQLKINESMELTFSGVADQIVVFTGDQSHDYALRDSSNTGFVVNKGLFSYSYSTPGTFHVVCVASTYDTYMGGGLQSATTAFDVTVTDDVTTIDKIYSTITPNVYYAEAVDEENWVMCLPVKQMYNNREIAINAGRQRLSFEIASDSSKIYVDDVLYDSRAYYNLTSVLSIRARSNYGSVREYKLYPMIYPEFTNLKIDGKSASLTRNPYYQDLQTYSVEDVTGKAEITFDVEDGVCFLANGVEVKSGESIDLGNTTTTYTLVRTASDNSRVKAVSRILFK